jgi:hypothetical protein
MLLDEGKFILVLVKRDRCIKGFVWEIVRRGWAIETKLNIVVL